ncbi:MAG: hypothetical protein ACK5LX_09985 [Oscillospiraceae bacterium]
MSGFFVLLVVMLLLALLWQVNKVPKNVLLLADEDEDIKIVGSGSFSEPPKDPGEEMAEEYRREKSSGNIEVAVKIGENYAGLLWEKAQDLIMEENGLSNQEVHQILLLYSYVVNKVIAERVPNPLLAQTALSRFYAGMEEKSSILYGHVSDTAAFSLYILLERSGGREEEAGEIFARLCGAEDDAAVIARGNKLYGDFCRQCQECYDEWDNFVS